ncbi:microsomal epoxide hydrolase [Actinoplanes italicus]|uniref:Pimeloyl-ACP methyl ester carboxylesterase n=1 Tax=Actinoplanes italicus TaxID=113567 RepID=A0A2T0K3Q8_9ACTN|nr:epoxide hydrolase family protein [Actinoplanes italicus]PRX17513.1 pimeloyl-ACP methyl ester carboxylesterase [Actinoplanes italicus]GIE34800.1 microsomal epoxide hydrolase [Actinoplanes italicus]
MTAIRPFRIDISDTDLQDLRDRLARTRWTPEIPGQGWQRGVPVDYLRGLAAYWAGEFDWRAAEARLNQLPQFLTEVDGQTLHFAHVRSADPAATPLLITHDWPASFAIYLPVVEALRERFHLVLMSNPGVGYSGPLTSPGWTTARTAAAFHEVMARLGYERYGVQGNGGGAATAVEMGRQEPSKVIGVHVNGHITFPSDDPADFAGLTEAEQARLGRLQEFRDDKMGFNAIQSTRPQTLAHGLHDSPAGQLAWIVEKFQEWTDPAATLPEDAVDRDLLLTNVSLYWFTGTAGSSANLYWEMAHDPSAWAPKPKSSVPLGVALGVTDITIQRYAERDAPVTHWTELPAGGNFLSAEEPKLFSDDVKTFFDAL